MKIFGMQITTNKILWLVYLALLAVLLPHTSWLFSRFEPVSQLGDAAAGAAAFAFECSIAVLTHKLSQLIEKIPKKITGLHRFQYQYLNAYSLGLLVSVGVSALANLAHSVEFGRSLAIFEQWGIQPKVYQLAFGAVLPFVSLLFARVLSNSVEVEETVSPELAQANESIRELRKQVRESEQRIRQTEQQAEEARREKQAAEERFAALGDLFARIFNGEKKQRIIAIKQQWPSLPNSAIAIMTESAPSTVSEVLKTLEAIDVRAE